ncbi:hypothetical protein DT019_18650 [Streptomyces sp. SDr-06]|nr:hypothetical protein DT019_18650 [Streptomyces sp. SDr-06]
MLAGGRAAGMATVALTTAHRVDARVADVVAKGRSAVSAQVTAGGAETSSAEWVRPQGGPGMSGIRTSLIRS